MKKLLLTLLTVLMISLLFTLSTPVQAGPPTNAAGIWRYKPTIVSTREAGCNTFFTTNEEGIWMGTFQGTSTEKNNTVVIRCSGAWSFKGTVIFSEVTVNGKSGTLEMSVAGARSDEKSDWRGKWVIIDGTDDLASLQGQGTWWGPGAPAPDEWGDIYYAGNIHFEPN